MQRRNFLKRAAACVSRSILALALGYPVLAFVTYTRRRTVNVVFSPSERLNRVSRKEGVFLIRKRGGFKALSSRCTHLGCTVRHDPVSDRFVCPCHGSVFDGKGRRLEGPAGKDLETLPLTVNERGEVEVSYTL